LIPERMTPIELRASVGLASIYGLRMFGMFIILPVFAVYAEHLPGGQDHALIGLALGAYGLTQALLQLPFGMLSDRIGRKRVIHAGLALFAIGSLWAALATDIYMVIAGRAIQGAGAISAAVTALLADLTREEHRTKAMAMIGATIGLTFASSLVLGPALYHAISIPGIFALTGALALAAMAVVRFAVPDPRLSRFHSDAEAAPARLGGVLRNGELMRLNFGIFALHAVQMAMFVVVPFALKQTGNIDANHHWQVYLPVMVVSFVLMIPPIVYGEKRGRLKPVFVGAVALMFVTQLTFAAVIDSFWGILTALVMYFAAFNVLEASLPSLISKIAPSGAKGTAIGVYNTAQSLGLFAGGVLGGLLSSHYGASAVFVFGAVLILLWLAVAAGMQSPPPVKTLMLHLRDGLSPAEARALQADIAALPGVVEALVIADEAVAYLKIDPRVADRERIEAFSAP
jgi:MFS family permease